MISETDVMMQSDQNDFGLDLSPSDCIITSVSEIMQADAEFSVEFLL